MKRVFSFLAVMLLCSISYADVNTVYDHNKVQEAKGWRVHVLDDDIDATAELLTELDSTYAQLAAEDTIEILSASAADITQTVTISGINNKGKRIIESIALDTSAGTTVVGSVATFRYIDQVEVDKECAGAITVRRATGDTLITSIPVGSLNAEMAQHFNGEKTSYVTAWTCGATTVTGSVLFELRWYPDDADSLDAGDGYRVLDRVYIDGAVTSPYSPSPRNYPSPIALPKGGWLAVYGTGGAANSDGYSTIEGYDL